MNQRHMLQSYARIAVALALALILLMPVLWLVQMSLRPAGDFLSTEFPFTPSLESYGALWTGNFPKSFGNSMIVSTLSTLLALLIGVPAAYVLERARFRYRRGIAFLILSTRMAPPIAFTIPYFLAFRYAGLHDTLTGLTLVYLSFNLALVVWMMQTFFAQLPGALEEAASIDGCSPWQSFRMVALPLVAPGLGATGVLCFTYSWNDFFFALILTRTHAMTAPVAIVNFMQFDGWEWGKIAAAAVMVMLPVVVFTMLVRRFLVAGLTAGAVKE